MRVTLSQGYIEKRNSIAYEYIDFFERMGYQIILIPNNTNNIKKYFEEDIDLVVLSGGNNVNPELYQSEDSLSDIFSERDDIEKTLLEMAIKNDIPLFGICRGSQFINVYYGGKVSHDIIGHVNKQHMLTSSLTILNHKTTNSFHNQGIKVSDLAEDLQSIAENENYIEAFKHRTLKIFGVQWHPERQRKIFDQELIKNFIKGKV